MLSLCYIYSTILQHQHYENLTVTSPLYFFLKYIDLRKLRIARSILSCSVSRFSPRRDKVQFLIQNCRDKTLSSNAHANATHRNNLHISQSHFTQQQEADVIGARCHTVVGGFRHRVCKVDSFTEHVAGDWGFRRSDAQTLEKD